ncbi:monovalent cation/H(+) antiporter subunit G [Thioalkalivibrio sp.]|uniref:monovalent cation/H(+) antiporter subunit G n=1 Tax=Thioalkalivibrio sp. TaxID=2093813 RepID=UPI003561465B
MTEFFTGLFLVAGAAFMMVAALGLVRMPDLPMRLHSTTKAGVLGAGLMMVGVAVYFGDGGVTTRAVAVIGFLLLTAPVAAHAIGRAGYFVGVPLWKRSKIDELKGRYDQKTHTLESPPEMQERSEDGTPRT